jgi:hypothetical protein
MHNSPRARAGVRPADPIAPIAMKEATPLQEVGREGHTNAFEAPRACRMLTATPLTTPRRRTPPRTS